MQNTDKTVTDSGTAPSVKLYEQIARIIDARIRCIETNNDWWMKHDETLRELNDLLPSGSGIDNGTKLCIEESKPNRLVFSFGYHHMNDGGMYDGWTEHTLVVTPSLMSRFDLRITGSNRNQIKDYLYEVFQSALDETIDFDDETRKYFVVSWRESAAQFQAGVKAGTII